jgi:hypothetical protein
MNLEIQNFKTGKIQRLKHRGHGEKPEGTEPQGTAKDTKAHA